MSEFLAAFDEVSVLWTYSSETEKIKENNRMLQMDWMTALAVEIAVSVCRITIYGCVNVVTVAMLLNTSNKVMQEKFHMWELY